VLAAFVGGLVAHKLKQPLLVGYIVAGVLIGPYTGGPTVSSIHDIELLAEIGVALLLFALGIEVSLNDLKPVRWIALVGGPMQILLTAVFGYYVGTRFLGFSTSDSLWFGGMISVSSTMVVLKTLTASGRMSTLASRVMLGMLLIQDLAVAPMLIILPKLSEPSGVLEDVLVAVGQAVLFLLVMIVFGSRLIPWLLRKIVGWDSRELFLVAIVALGIGVGYGTYLFGLSFALGAFVAGMVLSESELSHQALSDVVSLRDIFGIIFFVSVGMLFNPAYLVDYWGSVLTVCVLVLVGKFFIFYFLARLFGYFNMAPTIVGLGLAQVGEFSFVLARSGLSGGYISSELFSLMITTTVLTLLFSPALSRLARPMHRILSTILPQRQLGVPYSPLGNEFADHIVIAGCGRTGRAVKEVLEQMDLQVVVIDMQLQLLHSLGETPYVWGDSTKLEILRAAGIENAKGMIITIPNSRAIRLTVEGARKLNPTLNIFCRASNKGQRRELQQLGVVDTVQPEFEAGIKLATQVLENLDVPAGEIEELQLWVRARLGLS
jgi:CPA2 family monovalent cation:H+ antiporter-2